MAGNIDARLKELGIELPQAAAPAANYVPTVQSGSMLYISGQLPMLDGQIRYKGKLGGDVSVEDGTACARLCAINILAQAKAALGDLDRVARIVKLVGFVNSTPDFGEQSKVVNGASDLMVAVLGERGRHTRSAVGVASLPMNAAVEIDAILKVR